MGSALTRWGFILPVNDIKYSKDTFWVKYWNQIGYKDPAQKSEQVCTCSAEGHKRAESFSPKVKRIHLWRWFYLKKKKKNVWNLSPRGYYYQTPSPLLRRPFCNSAHICSWCGPPNQSVGWEILKFHPEGPVLMQIIQYQVHTHTRTRTHSINVENLTL